MIKIKDYEIPNQVTELSIEQFQKVSDISSDMGLAFVDKQIKIFECLGCPDVWDEVSAKELKEFITAFNDVPKVDFEFTKEVEIDGYKYVAFTGEEFELSAKDLALIEKKIKNGESDIAYIMAVIFKREDLDKKEHYAEAHIKQKAKLFSKQPAQIAVRYIAKVGQEASNMVENVAQNND